MIPPLGRALRRVWHRLAAAGVLLLVLVAVLLTGLRLALPLASGLQDRLGTLLSERVGYPVRVGGLDADMRGWSPRLTLGDTTVADPAGGPDLMRADRIELVVDLPGTLRLGSLQLRSVALAGARVGLRRLADGTIRLEGIWRLLQGDPRTQERFLRQGRLSLTGSEVRFVDDRDGLPMPRLEGLRLDLVNRGSSHWLELAAHPVAAHEGGAADRALDARLRVMADLAGSPSAPERWGGDLYLSLGGADLPALVPPQLLAPRSAHAGSALLEGWAQAQAGTISEVTGRIGLRGLKLSARSDKPRGTGPDLEIGHLDGIVRARRDGPDGWALSLRDFGLSLPGGDLPDLGLDLDLGPKGQLRGLDLATGAFELELADAIAPWLAGDLVQGLPATLRERLADLAQRLRSLRPRGLVERLALSLNPAPVLAPADPDPGSDGPAWRIAAAGRDLGIERSGPIPGIAGLDWRLEADQAHGTLRLASEGLDLDLSPLFDRLPRLDQLSGALAWERRADGALHLTGRRLHLENPDLSGRARFDLSLPAPRTIPASTGAPPSPGGSAGAPSAFLDLRATFRDANGARTRSYLPVGTMAPELVVWLERGIRAGRVPQADLVLRGPLGAYPFRGREGRFELVLDFEDGTLDYLEGWPPIEEAVGTLHFLDQGLDIQLHSGRIYATRIGAGQAAIPDLWSPRHLPIRARGEGPMADGLRLFRETPLSRQLGPLGRSLEVDGRSDLALDLDVPLAPGEPLTVDGRVTWPGAARLAVKDTPIVLTDPKGALTFTVDSIGSDDLAARLWDRPIALSIATQNGGDPKASVTRIGARSRLVVSELARRFPSPAWTLARGECDWTLDLSLRNADLTRSDLPIAFQLRSDLDGLALVPPPPVGKRAGETRPVEIDGTLVPGRSLGLRGRLDELDLALELDLGVSGARPEREASALGSRSDGPGGAVSAVDLSALAVTGSLARLDLPAWSSWWSDFRGGPESGALSLAPDPGLLRLDLRIGRLGLGGGALSEARIRNLPQPGGLRLQLDARELAGRLTLPGPGSDAPLDLGLERLDLKALLPAGEPGQPSVRGDGKDALGRPPALDLRVQDLRWGKASLGSLDLGVRPDPAGIRIPRIALAAPGETRVTGDAAWTDAPSGGTSRLDLALVSADTGPVLSALDYTPALSAAPLTATLGLEWPGGFESFALARASGAIDLKVGPGRLLEVEPGVGRVLGFLNLGALRRRLSLDFRDLYEQGFSFEEIRGRIRIGGGKAQLSEFAIDGPASAIRIGGTTDLRTRTFDQSVTVEPRIGTGVALAGAVAGGPVVGAAVYLMNKLSGGGIDRLSSYSYRVTGPWGDPVLTPVGWEPFGTAPSAGRDSSPPAASRPKRPRPPKPPQENLFLE